MPTAALIETADAVAVREQFAELICADERLVRAEFDALIAATWDEPCVPGQRRHRTPPSAHRPSRARVWYRDDGRDTEADPELAPQARERSPPRQAACR